VCAAPEDLAEAVRNLDVSSLQPFERGSPDGIIRALNDLVGMTQSDPQVSDQQQQQRRQQRKVEEEKQDEQHMPYITRSQRRKAA